MGENGVVPIPSHHNGDTGVSNEFADNTRIMVALVFGMPTAYHVCLDKAGGSLKPKSYNHSCLNNNMSDLLDIQDQKVGLGDARSDIGDERFCVIYSSLDFGIEYENLGKSASVAVPSIQILSSKNFNHHISKFRIDSPLSFCLASAPASQRCFPCREIHDADEIIPDLYDDC